jgi:hypothetical protein
MALATSTNPLVASIAGGRELALADAGRYYVAVTPAPGTGIITSGSVQAFTETTPFLVVYNPGPFNVYPAYLRLRVSVAGVTDSAATFLTNTLDIGNRLSAIGSGTVLTVANTNAGSANASKAVCSAGPITASAATGSRIILSHSQVRSLKIGVIHDTIAVNWGAPTQSLVSMLINNTTTHSDTVVNCAPVVIAPLQSMVMVHWAASQTTGTTYEVEFAYVEK